MKLNRPDARNAVTRRATEAVILFAVGPNTFAIPAKEVDEIRDLHELRSIAHYTARTEVAKVKSTLVRERKTYFVVEAGQHFRLEGSKPSRVMILRNSRAAVAVDSIDRIVEIQHLLSLPHAFHGEERRWYRGLALLGDDNVVAVVDSTAFLSASELTLVQGCNRLAKGAAV